MKYRLIVFMGIVAAMAASVSSCSGKTPENGRVSSSGNTSPPVSSGSPAGLPYAGVPKVVNPLPASVLAGNPCSDALTSEQIATLLGSPVRSEGGETPGVGPDCGWTNPDRGSQIGVGYDITTRIGLSGVYQNTKPKSAVWKPITEIQGFPAVAHAGQPGRTPPADFCAVSIGLADDLAIDVSVSLGRAKIGVLEPCDAARQAADAAVATLKAKAGD